MTETSWTAIAVTTMTLISSWLKFWAERRSDRPPKAKPDANRPRPIDRLVRKEITFWQFLKASWVRILIQWTGNFVGAFLLVSQYRSNAPLTRHSAVFIALTASLWVYFSILFYIFDEKFPAVLD
jgi:hypothetical protein